MTVEPKPEKRDLAKIVSTALGAAYFGAYFTGTAFGMYYLDKKYSGNEWVTLMLAGYSCLTLAGYFAIPAGAFYLANKAIDMYKKSKTREEKCQKI